VQSVFEDSCYYTDYGKRSWLDSQALCESDGANLVSIHSEEENIFATGMYFKTNF